MKTAIAYVSDVILGTTGEVISCAEQKRKIEAHAAECGIEIVGWYEDKVWTDSLFERPGFQALLAARDTVDAVLVERVWCLSRNWKELREAIGRLEKKGARIETATTLWDCVSQMARQHYAGHCLKRPERAAVVAHEVEPVRVRKPARLHFMNISRAHSA